MRYFKDKEYQLRPIRIDKQDIGEEKKERKKNDD